MSTVIALVGMCAGFWAWRYERVVGALGERARAKWPHWLFGPMSWAVAAICFSAPAWVPAILLWAFGYDLGELSRGSSE